MIERKRCVDLTHTRNKSKKKKGPEQVYMITSILCDLFKENPNRESIKEMEADQKLSLKASTN
jgi:hypothetical protein